MLMRFTLTKENLPPSRERRKVRPLDRVPDYYVVIVGDAFIDSLYKILRRNILYRLVILGSGQAMVFLQDTFLIKSKSRAIE